MEKWINGVLRRFVKGAMNIVDLLGILPYFMSLILSLVTVSRMMNWVEEQAETKKKKKVKSRENRRVK